MTQEIIRQWAAIAISLLSFVLAGIALGWNVYRDVVLKARVKVSFSVSRVVGFGQRVGQTPDFVTIAVTNHGPGIVRVDNIVGKSAPLWRRLAHRVQHFFIVPDFSNPLNPKLPVKLEVGDTIHILLPYDENSVLNGTATDIGVSDSFGRSHFSPRRQLREAKAQFAKDFPKARGRVGV